MDDLAMVMLGFMLLIGASVVLLISMMRQLAYGGWSERAMHSCGHHEMHILQDKYETMCSACGVKDTNWEIKTMRALLGFRWEIKK